MKPLLRIIALLLITPAFLAADDESDDRINENSIMLVQAILNLPESMIGGVSLEDRGDFLNLISHYGDIDFAKGFFQLGGDGARAYDKPVSWGFRIKLFDQSGGRPLCIITKKWGVDPPISIISFGEYWRWEDVTEKHLPQDPKLDRPYSVELSPDSNEATVLELEKITTHEHEYFRRGSKIGMMVWKDDQFTFVEEE